MVYGRTSSLLYSPGMARVEVQWLNLEQLRRELGQRIKLAHEKKIGTVVTVRGTPDAVIVPFSWFREQIGEPIEYIPAYPDEPDEDAGS